MSNIAIRVDASLEIGTGHVMRCLTLANELKAKGSMCHFICREHIGSLISIIAEHGHDIRVLRGPEEGFGKNERNLKLKPTHASWLG